MKKIKIFHFVNELLIILNDYKTTNFRSFLCLLINFLQMISYIYKANMFELKDDKIIFFLRGFYYCSFVNILAYFSNDLLTFIVFYIIVGLVHFLLFYIIIKVVIKQLFVLNFKGNRFVWLLDSTYKEIFMIFIWILAIPLCDICYNITDCEVFSFLVKNKNDVCEIPLFIWILAVWTSIIIIFLTYVYLWIYSDSSFLDDKDLKMSFNLSLILKNLAKFVLILSFSVIYNSNHFYIYFLMHVYAIISLVDYIKYFPIRNRILNKLYISSLLCYESINTIFNIWEFTSLLTESNVFYICIILVMISFKLGFSIHNKIYLFIIMSDLKVSKYECYYLEELIHLIMNEKINLNDFFLSGIILNHKKHCRKSGCKLKTKYLNKFFELSKETKFNILTDYVSQIFLENIKSKSRGNLKESFYLERNILKYTSFLTQYTLNPSKSLHEIIRIMVLYPKTSFLFNCYKFNLLKQIKNKILENEREKRLNQGNNYENSKEIDILLVLEIIKEKRILENKTKELLKEKIKFWDRYKEGYHSYESVISSLINFTRKTIEYEKNLKELLEKSVINKSRKLYLHKYNSFYHCVILNNINEGVKIEEELENIRKREYVQDKNILGYSTFYNDEIINMKVSILNHKGKILDESRTKKLAAFFDYNLEEIKSINLTDFMPKIIGENHHLFVNWFLNRPKDSKENGNKYIDTYAKNKKGLIFPIKIYSGLSFDYKDDFVLHGIIMKNYQRAKKSLIFDEKGDIKGIDNELFQIFLKDFPNLTIDNFTLLNIFSFIPTLQETITKNKIIENTSDIIIRNQSASFYLPTNLMEILEILNLKKKEDDAESNRFSMYSGRSYKSSNKTEKEKDKERLNKSKSVISSISEKKGSSPNRGQPSYMSKLYATKVDIPPEQRMKLARKIENNTLNNYDLLNELFDIHHTKKSKIVFDLKTHFYTYGGKLGQNIFLGYLNIHKSRTLTDLQTNSNFLGTTNIQSSFNKSLENEPEVPEKDQLSSITDFASGFIHMPPENNISFREISNVGDKKSNLDITESAEVQLSSPGRAEIKQEELNRNLFLAPSETSKHVINPNLITTINSVQNNEMKASILIQKEESNIEKDSKSQYDSSLSKKDDKEKLEKLKNNTTDKGVLDINENNSHNPSSISGIKKTYSIFNAISQIRKKIPKSITNMNITQFLIILIIAVYCAVIYKFSIEYMSVYYEPLEQGLIKFSSLATSISTVTISIIQLELYKNNIIHLEERSLGKDIFYEIIERTFKEQKAYINAERNNPTVFEYQKMFKNDLVTSIDIIFYKTKEYTFVDLLDEAWQSLQDYYKEVLDKQRSDLLSFFPVNFPYIIIQTNLILYKCRDEFHNSNTNTFSSILAVLIIFIILSLIISVYQYIFMKDYESILVRLLNIFLRINQKSGYNELLFSKELYEDMISEEQKNILNIYYPDKCLNKTDYAVPFIDDFKEKSSSTKKSVKISKKFDGKKFSFHNLKPISLFKYKIFVFLAFSTIFSYLFFNFYFWQIVNLEITNLIGINVFFNTIYTLPSLTQCFNLLVMREKILNSQQLYNSGIPNQTFEGRLNYFASELAEHVEQLEDLANQFPDYLFSAQTDINDDTLNKLIGGNSCEVLFDYGIIEEEEFVRCPLLAKGAFTYGNIATLNEIINYLKLQGILTDIPKSDNELEDQRKKIREYFNSTEAENMVITEHFFEETNVLFFKYLEIYYSNLTNNQVRNLEQVILISTIFIGLGFVCILIGMRKYMIQKYKYICVCLNLIPYERLVNDEQTVFLIKKFIK